MCRWITVLSSEDFCLRDIIFKPSHSLIQMSVDASWHPGYSEVNNHVMNGDGFGIGWYYRPTERRLTENGENGIEQTTLRRAAVFKDILPAWNNLNLREICESTMSDCFIAHVRAASPGTGVNQVNCHPFKVGRLMFCHNGRIQQFILVRRRMQALFTDHIHQLVRGTTDSENIFALLLTYLSQDGTSDVPPWEQTTPFGHERLIRAIKKTLRQIEILSQEAGLGDGFNTCNFSLTDGDSMVCTRFCSKSPHIDPPSLYFAFGDAQDLYKELTDEEQDELLLNHVDQHDDLTEPMTDTSSLEDDGDSSAGEESGSESDQPTVLRTVPLQLALSKPGKILSNVDAEKACLIVSSNPLTKTHTWHRMPKNSILWYKRGSFPELRLIASNTKSMDAIMAGGMLGQYA